MLPLLARGADQTTRTVRIGYFEGGKYPIHDLLREEYFKQLDLIMPSSVKAVPTPKGYYSASWNRDTCRQMAAALAKNDNVDIVLAMGPWVVEDLIAAGFKKPIIGMHQFFPLAQHLIDTTGRPVVENLTVQERPGKIVRDLTVLSKLIPIKRLGVLYFPSGQEEDSVVDYFKAIGKHLGFEVVSADGYNDVGTYAYFKAFGSLDKHVDAIYLAPLWGFDMEKIDEFFRRTNAARIPTFVSDGKVLIEKGAFGTASYYDAISEARYNAYKTVEIIQGAKPADLNANFVSGLGLAVNNATAVACGINLSEHVLDDFYVVDAPTPESADRYSVAEAINRAINQNPDYLSKYNAMQAASHAAGAVLAEYYPQLNGVTAVSRVDKDLSRYAGGPLDKNQFVAGLNLQQQIFSYSTIKSIQVAAGKKNLAQTDLQQARLDLEYAVTQAYLNYLRASDVKNALENNRSLVEYNLELARAMNQLESQDTVDVIRLEDLRYRLTARIADARKEVKVARVLLNTLFNLPGNTPFILDSGAYSQPKFWRSEDQIHDLIDDAPSQQALTDRLIDSALTRSPQIGKYDLLVNIAHNRIGENTGSFLPDVGFRASLDYADRISNDDGYPTGRSSWTVGGVLSWPLFLGSKRISQRKQLRASLNETEYLKDAEELQVRREVANGVHQLASSANAMASTYEAQSKAYQALDMVVSEYASGKADLIKLLSFQENALDADLATISARFTYFDAVADVVHAVGGTTDDQSGDFLSRFQKLAQKK